MLRKIIWFALILFVGYVWFSFLINCSNKSTAERMSQLDSNLGDNEEVVFKADEDSGDDEYIISDESDEMSEGESMANAGSERNYKEAPGDYVENEDDFVEKSPAKKERKRSISREAIQETTYTTDESIGYYVITGSFSDEFNADNMVESLKDMGYSRAEKVVFDFSQYYSVVSGKYDTESSARAKSLELKNKNINAYVHKMRSKLYGE